jgi:hypothetical protein
MGAPFQVVLPAGQDAETLAARLPTMRPLAPFSPEAVGFCNDLSKAILGARALRQFPEAVAFGYWIRAGHLKRLEAAYRAKTHAGMLAPRGLAFHIAPSNVDTIFLYSLVLSMLAGNANIVRLSRRENDQLAALVGLLGEVLSRSEHAGVAQSLAVVRYDPDDAVTRRFTEACDIRVVWGGDATIDAMRQIPLTPRAVELTFADKVSLAVLDAAAYLALEDDETLIRGFIRDSYGFGQMACSSPRLVLWAGETTESEAASARFWDRVEATLGDSANELGTMDFMNKLVAEQSFAVARHGHIRATRDNRVTVVRLDDLAAIPFDEHCGGGLFLEGQVADLYALATHLTRRHQTVTSFGINRAAWLSMLATAQPVGIDRIVPVGQALDFDVVWDGYDLMHSFSREIAVADLPT